MVKLITSFALVANVLAQSNLTSSHSGTIYLVRHGEKGSDGCENSAGMQRANKLYDLLSSKYDAPSYVYAYMYGSGTCQRCEQTAKPIAKQIGMSSPNTHHGHSDCSTSDCTTFAEDVKEKLSTHSVILLVLEHQRLQPMAHALGVPSSKIPHWSHTYFDGLWKVKLSGGKAEFEVYKQYGDGPSPSPPSPSGSRRRRRRRRDNSQSEADETDYGAEDDLDGGVVV